MATLRLNLGELAADIEGWCDLCIDIDYGITPGDPGDRDCPPTGPQVDVLACWIGVEPHRVNILAALDSLDIGLTDSILAEVEHEEPDGPDEDAQYEAARDREEDRDD
jgi:hypothetical protein